MERNFPKSQTDFQQIHAESNHDSVAENELPTMATLFLAVDEQIDKEPMVIKFENLSNITHDDAASEVDEVDETISIFENTAITETLNEAPINQNATKRSRLRAALGFKPN